MFRCRLRESIRREAINHDTESSALRSAANQGWHLQALTGSSGWLLRRIHLGRTTEAQGTANFAGHPNADARAQAEEPLKGGKKKRVKVEPKKKKK